MLILGSVAYGAKYYYDTTQETISVLRTNNATLETVNKQVTTQFEEYRKTVEQEIENFKAEVKKQQELNNELNTNLKKVQDANKEISKLLANTDIIKNSLADPKASEEKINEEVDVFFSDISCVTDDKCLQ
jgi:chromosome segregation ATPase|tara:strand:+ start:1224 stop:1616 length:393 start_codon:yes stop_codon:yes gene_type:complete